MTHDVETFNIGSLTVRIQHDDSPESPREWDNLGVMTCWHRRHNLGDKHHHAAPDDLLWAIIDDDRLRERLERRLEKARHTVGSRYPSGGYAYLAELRQVFADHNTRVFAEVEKRAVILPLYLYDHSGITMATTPFNCPWDSGRVGYVHATLDAIRKEYGVRAVTKRKREKVAHQLRQEVKTYDEFLRGDVYGFIVEDEMGNHLDSCWSIHGLEYCREEARSSAEHEARHYTRETATA